MLINILIVFSKQVLDNRVIFRYLIQGTFYPCNGWFLFSIGCLLVFPAKFTQCLIRGEMPPHAGINRVFFITHRFTLQFNRVHHGHPKKSTFGVQLFWWTWWTYLNTDSISAFVHHFHHITRAYYKFYLQKLFDN